MPLTTGRELLTPHEIRIIQALAEEGTIRGAARVLGLRSATVDWNLDCVRRKTGLHYGFQIVAWAAQNGLLQPIQFVAHKIPARSGGGRLPRAGIKISQAEDSHKTGPRSPERRGGGTQR